LFQAEGFLAVDELLLRTAKVLDGMVLDEAAMARNLAIYGPFAATERVLMALVGAGASRQEAHEWIRQASLSAWAAMREGQDNPLVGLLTADPQINEYLTPPQIHSLMAAETHIGTAATRAADFAQVVRRAII
jgi:adenylosuccinate lyase